MSERSGDSGFQEIQLFRSRLEDAIDYVAAKGGLRFIGFLDERLQVLAKDLLRQRRFEKYCFYGGYPEAQRVFLCTGSVSATDSFPIASLCFRYRGEDRYRLAHRDFLGSIIALGVKRESLGDILVGEGIGVVFCTEPVARLVEREVTKIGRVGVSVSRDLPKQLPVSYSLEERRYNVSSLRIDCIVAAIVAKSRTCAVKMIRGALVSRNFAECTQVSQEVSEGDILSIRGYGRFIFERVANHTKKGRLNILVKKYV